jgi:transcriptional regulator with XRE-family HTH domain
MTVTLGQFIRARRRMLGLTQEELAWRMADGMTQSEISRLEIGLVTLPRAERLQRLAKVLDVSAGELLMHSAWAGDTTEESTENEPHQCMDRSLSDTRIPEDAIQQVQKALAQIKQAIDILQSVIDRGQPAVSSNGEVGPWKVKQLPSGSQVVFRSTKGRLVVEPGRIDNQLG